MGCLKSLIKKIIIIAIIVAFFAFGGFAFVKKKVNDYQNPPRNEFVKSEKDYGDFSCVSSDYQLTRSFNLFGYKKINAKYIPTGQKITIFDLKDTKKISPEDFVSDEINKIIFDILNKTKDSIITFEDFKIVQKGVYVSKGQKVPYVKFCAKVKNVPFKNVVGIVGAYKTKNEKAKDYSTKLILTIVDTKAFNPVIVSNFIRAVRF